MAVDIEHNIKEVEARPVEGDTPFWYDPNSYSRMVKVVDGQTGELFFVDLNLVQQIDLKGLKQDDRIDILKQFSTGTVPVRTESRQVKEAAPMPFSNPGVLAKRNPSMQVVQQQVVPPTIKVDFKFLDTPVKFSFCYHHVIVSGRYIILVLDKRGGGPQQFELDIGIKVLLTIQQKNMIDVPCTATGINFTHKNEQFIVFFVESMPETDSEEPFPGDTEHTE